MQVCVAGVAGGPGLAAQRSTKFSRGEGGFIRTELKTKVSIGAARSNSRRSAGLKQACRRWRRSHGLSCISKRSSIHLPSLVTSLEHALTHLTVSGCQSLSLSFVKGCGQSVNNRLNCTCPTSYPMYKDVPSSRSLDFGERSVDVDSRGSARKSIIKWPCQVSLCGYSFLWLYVCLRDER